jgi:hypothetical protein
MSPLAKASPGAKRQGDSSDQPLGGDLDAQPPATFLQELAQRSESQSAFKEDINPFNEPFEHDAHRPNSPFVVKLQASAAPANSPAHTPSPVQRPASRPRVFSNKRVRKPKNPIPDSNSVKDRVVGKAAETAVHNVRTEKEQGKQKNSPQSTSAHQELSKALAKSWKERFLASEEKERLKSKLNGVKNEDKEKDKDIDKKSGRARSQTIRRSNSDADESEDWEHVFTELNFFEEPEEWLIAQGLVPAGAPPPSPRPRPYDGENESGDWEITAINMNNSYNFDPNMNSNAARQAPNAAQGQQINGLNGGQHWPNVGAQADMNVLWEYIQNLSQMHEGIRAQTQHVLNGVQQIQARAAGDGDAAPHVNGVSNGIFIALTSQERWDANHVPQQVRPNHRSRKSHGCKTSSRLPTTKSKISILSSGSSKG